MKRMTKAPCDWWRVSVTPAEPRMCKTCIGCRSLLPSHGKVSAQAQGPVFHDAAVTLFYEVLAVAADDAGQVASLSETLRSTARA